ncbi:hypothetical protein EAI_09997 [Harpegnathos saltator]|uniref:Uncharacterized protein n=1 Tax=Harpegnathos saltator TaxID=610380 RepID=E2BJ59_HARSA|nr:hypothetical protein EAI_09997 [Harpegnathos saltator]
MQSSSKTAYFYFQKEEDHPGISPQKRIIGVGFHRRRSSWDSIAEEDRRRIPPQKRIIVGFHRRRESSQDSVAEENRSRRTTSQKKLRFHR